MVDVFVDTSAWYALRVATDQNHPKAVPILRKLLEQKAWLHTSDWVFVETCALITNRVGRQDALRAGDWILRNPAIRFHPVGESSEDAWNLFENRDGSISLVDCGSFAVMSRLGLTRAFAFDADFERHGLQVERPAAN